MRLGVLVVFAAGVLAGAAPPGDDGVVVRTPSGRLRGRVVGDIASFEGIPFAAPPVGELRWRAPAPVAPWTGIRDARAYGAPCAQAGFDWNRAVAAGSREDCLTLNVWAPVHRGVSPLPVLVFFPGGAFHGGSARGLTAIEPSYDGTKLARQGVVVVTANYRLGMFGFLAHPALAAESPRHASGNYGLMDNIAALRWVRATVGRFGGDAGNVTAIGQSAGADSVRLLMTSAQATGLFGKAILQSPFLTAKPVRPDRQAAEAAGVAFATALGAPKDDAIPALRRRTAQDLLHAMMADPRLRHAEPRDPIVDGDVITQQPEMLFAAGREAAIPLIVGNTARDGDLDDMGVAGNPNAAAAAANPSPALASTHRVAPLTADGAKAVQAFFAPDGTLATRAARLYGNASATDPVDGDVLTAFDTDVYFRCGASLIAQRHARIAPTWRYEFSHGYEPLGATHLWDMLYLFGWLLPPAQQKRDARLVAQMQGYWAGFARGGIPQAPGLPNWPRTGGGGAYLDFASAGAVSRTGLRTAACDLFALRILKASK